MRAHDLNLVGWGYHSPSNHPTIGWFALVDVIENIKCILFRNMENIMKYLKTGNTFGIHANFHLHVIFIRSLYCRCANVTMPSKYKRSSWRSCKGTVKHMCRGMKMGQPCKIGKQIRPILLEVTTV